MKTKQEKNGQREIINEAQFRAWFGDNVNDPELMEELVLDIANDIYSVADFVQDVKSYDA